MTHWKERFDKEFPDPMTNKYGAGFKLYCTNCSGENLDKIRDFISKEIIEKIIDEIPNESEHERFEDGCYADIELITLKQQLKDRWL